MQGMRIGAMAAEGTDLVAFIYDTDDQSRARTEALLGELSGDS